MDGGYVLYTVLGVALVVVRTSKLLSAVSNVAKVTQAQGVKSLQFRGR